MISYPLGTDVPKGQFWLITTIISAEHISHFSRKFYSSRHVRNFYSSRYVSSVKVYFSTIVFGIYLYWSLLILNINYIFLGGASWYAHINILDIFYRYFYFGIDFISILHFTLLSSLCIAFCNRQFGTPVLYQHHLYSPLHFTFFSVYCLF